MAVKNIRKLLIDIAKENESVLMAKLIAFYYPRIKKDLNRNSVFEFLKSIIDLEVDINIDEIDWKDELTKSFANYENKDFRIKSFRIANLRGIDNGGEKKTPYGIDFTDQNRINNAIILANNGIGKSSLFAGLEMVYAQEIGERNLRSKGEPKTKDYKNYLQRFNTQESPFCEVVTNSGIFNLNNPLFPSQSLLQRYNPANHFVSDFDIYYYGQSSYTGDSKENNSFHNLIANSLGLTEYIALRDTLKQVVGYRRLKERNDWNNAKKEREDKEKTVKNITLDITQKQNILDQLKNQIAQTDVVKEQDTLTKNLKELAAKPLKPYNNIEPYKVLVDEYKRAYSKYLSIDRSDKSQLEHDFLAAGKELLNNSDDCPMCNKSHLTVEEIRNLVEKRLEDLKNHEASENNLRKKFNEISSELSQIFNTLKAFHFQINEEKEIIRTLAKLEALLVEEDNFFLSYLPIISDEPMFQFIDQLQSKFTLTDDDHNALLQFIDGPIIKDVEMIANGMKRLSELRATLLASYIEKLPEPINNTDKSVVLKEEIRRLQKQLDSSKSRISELIPQIEKLALKKDQVDRVKNEIRIYIPYLESEISKLVKQAYTPIKEVVENIMNDYLIDSGLKLEVSVKEEIVKTEDGEIVKEIIEAQLIDLKSNKNITPDKYFNTFRYRLFTLMISLSLALATREKYNVNLPLIMDDLFSGSDFISKNSFSEFLIKVIQLFHKYTPELPLQFILFTHDDLIFRSAIDALDNFNSKITAIDNLHADNMQDLNDITLVGRIFAINESKKETLSYSEGDSFQNIMYKLPKHILID